MSDLAAALQVAIRTHAAQTDRQGEPYLLHVLRVVEAVSPGAKVVAALHDVLEDGSALTRDLPWDLSHPELRALSLLTRGGESYASYIDRIAQAEGPGNTLAREVKLADLHDNLGRIPPEPEIDGRGGAPGGFGETAYDKWVRNWSGLKRRYERAIATLETAERAHA